MHNDNGFFALSSISVDASVNKEGSTALVRLESSVSLIAVRLIASTRGKARRAEVNDFSFPAFLSCLFQNYKNNE